jgi:lipoprotein-anchoring transpeptidase ErfK/SrfK
MATLSVPASLLSQLAVAAVVLGSAFASPVSAGAASGRVNVQPMQELALLLEPHSAMSAPDPRSAELQTVTATRPITGEQTALPIVGQRTTGDGLRWLKVLLPGRPNGHMGWIRRRGTEVTRTPWHIVVHTSERSLTVFRMGHRVRTFPTVVGKPTTPTPKGEFFVEESVRLGPKAVGAPFALALSARSNVLQEFDGGPGQIALHGLGNIGGVLGTAVSHGCVRLGAAAIRWLAAHIGPGVPVTITR